jgi:hypothetical protein
MRSKDFSFSKLRTRIFNEPSCMDRSVSSIYAIFLGDVTAFSTSVGLSPVAFEKMDSFFSASLLYF